MIYLINASEKQWCFTHHNEPHRKKKIIYCADAATEQCSFADGANQSIAWADALQVRGIAQHLAWDHPLLWPKSWRPNTTMRPWHPETTVWESIPKRVESLYHLYSGCCASCQEPDWNLIRHHCRRNRLPQIQCLTLPNSGEATLQPGEHCSLQSQQTLLPGTSTLRYSMRRTRCLVMARTPQALRYLFELNLIVHLGFT